MRNDIEEMLKKIGSARPQEEFSLKMDDLPPLQPTKEKQNRIKYYLIPAVAAVLIVAVIGLTYLLPLSDSQNNGQGDTVSYGNSSDVINSVPNTDENDSNNSSSVSGNTDHDKNGQNNADKSDRDNYKGKYYDHDDQQFVTFPWDKSQNGGSSSPEAETAPWKNGSLELTTLTLSVKGNTSKVPTAMYGGSNRRIINLAGKPTDLLKQSNKRLSLWSDTEIRGCIDGRWLSIYTEHGEHANCEGLYYDLKEDRLVCIACKLLQLIKGNEYYLDACVRTAVEVYSMPTCEDTSLTYVVEKKYPLYYSALYESNALKVFAAGARPTEENMGVDFGKVKEGLTWDDTEMYRFSYPVVKVLEYGADLNKCFFALVSPDDNVAWGSFVYDFSQNKLYSVNGDGKASGVKIVGNKNFMYHYGDLYNYSKDGTALKRNEYLIMAELAFATDVTVSDDYKYIAVSAPYFATAPTYYDPKTGIWKNVYEEDNVFLIDIEKGTCKAMYDRQDSDCFYQDEIKDTNGPWPSEAPQFVEGEICFPTKRDSWRFNYKVEFKGDLVKIATLDNVKYVFIERAGNVRIFRLRDKYEVTDQLRYATFDSESYPKGATDELDFLKNESGNILGGSYVATASKSGRYVYLYYEYLGQVLCIDTETRETETVTVDTSFVLGADKLANIKYQLFVSDNGEQLFLTYYDDCRITFSKGATEPPQVVGVSNPWSEYYSLYMVNYISFRPCFYRSQNKRVFLDEESELRFIRCIQYLSCDAVLKLSEQYSSTEKTVGDDYSGWEKLDIFEREMLEELYKSCETVTELCVFNGETVYLPDSAVLECLHKAGWSTVAEFEAVYSTAMEHPIFY